MKKELERKRTEKGEITIELSPKIQRKRKREQGFSHTTQRKEKFGIL